MAGHDVLAKTCVCEGTVTMCKTGGAIDEIGVLDVMGVMGVTDEVDATEDAF